MLGNVRGGNHDLRRGHAVVWYESAPASTDLQPLKHYDTTTNVKPHNTPGGRRLPKVDQDISKTTT